MQWIDSLRGALSFWNKGLRNGESSNHQSKDLFPVGTLQTFPQLTAHFTRSYSNSLLGEALVF